MNRLTAIWSEAAQIIFDLSEAEGFVLAGGSALALSGESIEIDLAVDSPLLFLIGHVDGLPMLSPQDLATRKVLAILDRAEGRDFTNLWAPALWFSRPECVRWAKQLDSGVADEDIARAFGQLARLDDNELPCVAREGPTVRQQFAEWATELAGNPS